MFEKNYELNTVEGKHVTLTFKHTMRHDIRNRVMAHKFARKEDHPADWNTRSDFCWIVSRIVAVDGIEWIACDETATPEEFTQCYNAFTDMMVDEGFYECVRAVNDMVIRTDPIEKSDALLTDEEKADPNS